MNVVDSTAFFSETYTQARSQFLDAAAGRASAIEQFTNPIGSPGSEELITDVVRIGNANADKILFLISGTHGLEGLTGSGIQVGLLQTEIEQFLDQDMAVVLIHMLNPWGAHNLRRQNEQNIDNNRNFLDFSKPVPANPYAAKLHEITFAPDLFINGERGPEIAAKIQNFRKVFGENAFNTALFQGQYDIPAGVGFGGHARSWSVTTLKTIMQSHTTAANIVSVIDIHTGIGPYGYGMLINSNAAGSRALKKAQKWFGDELVAQNCTEDLPYRTKGHLYDGVVEFLPECTVIPIALEFGTFEVEQLMQLQIDDCWLENWGEKGSRLEQAIKSRLKQFFYPSDPAWKRQVYERGAEITHRALNRLKSERQ